MKILIAGASGLIGHALVCELEQSGLDVCRLVRREAVDSGEIEWDPVSGVLDPEVLIDFDVVVCLSGEGIADGRWSASKKERIRASRVQSVSLISECIEKCSSPPKVLICASAIGYYGVERGDDELSESSAAGDDFLAGVCRDWEDAASVLDHADVRVVHLRLGIVLSLDGGALAKMVLPLRIGLGGKLGNGQQWMSWVSIVDAVKCFCYAIETDTLAGMVNVTAPTPVRNSAFTAALGRRLHRFTPFRVPSFVIRLVLGEMGETLLLKGARVVPEKLVTCGFEFEHPTIDRALKELV